MKLKLLFLLIFVRADDFSRGPRPRPDFPKSDCPKWGTEIGGYCLWKGSHFPVKRDHADELCKRSGGHVFLPIEKPRNLLLQVYFQFKDQASFFPLENLQKLRFVLSLTNLDELGTGRLFQEAIQEGFTKMHTFAEAQNRSNSTSSFLDSQVFKRTVLQIKDVGLHEECFILPGWQKH